MAQDPRDTVPMGEPETVVYLPQGSLVGLRIPGVPGHRTLGIREDAHGQPVSCAEVADSIALDIRPAQSNPRRVDDRKDDDG